MTGFIKGAQQLATGGALSDFIQLSCIQPLQPGDENYANCLAVPVDAEGLKLYPRRSFSRAGSAFDYPLSSRFDESDNMSFSTMCSCRGNAFSSIAMSNYRAINGARRPRICSATTKRRRAM